MLFYNVYLFSAQPERRGAGPRLSEDDVPITLMRTLAEETRKPLTHNERQEISLKAEWRPIS